MNTSNKNQLKVDYLSTFQRNSFVVIMFVCVFIFTQLCLRYVTDVARNERLEKPLPDLYHNTLPESMRNWHEYSDFMPVIPLVLFHLLDKCKHFYEFWLLISIVYLMRAICFSVTVLPSPSRTCKCEWETEPETPLRQLLNILYQEGCNDNIFSGHTSMMVMSSLFLATYVVPNSTFCKSILVVYNIIGFLIIIGTRLHYTVDVFLICY